MADVAIIHAADKGTAAARLAEAIAASGFAARAVEIGDPAGLAEAVEASPGDARILIWSRALVSHALHSGELHRIRQIRGLIEVSADGIAPPSRGDENRIVSISGWRGQPFHPGWQKIHHELKRLCASRKAPAPLASPPPAVAKDPGPKRAAPAAPGGGPRPNGLRLMLGGGAAVLLVAAAVGASNWADGDSPAPPVKPVVRGPQRPAAIAQAPPVEPAAAPQSTQAPAAPLPVQDPPLPPPAPLSPERPVAAKSKAEASRAGAAVRARPVRPVARPRQQPAPAPVKKYSRKNSKVMREFCERAGRSTPQCRTFQRSQESR